jgi:L-threonylcarbamoyladenylate synthase
LLRPGGVAQEDIEKIIGKLDKKESITESPNSPGQLHIHYAPNIPIQFYEEEKSALLKNMKIGGIFFSEVKNKDVFSITKVLSTNNDLREAAANLFSYLHELESMNLDMIFIEKVEMKGLGIAIMDRLTKAVNKYL